MAEFDSLTLEHTPGSNNQFVDALTDLASRLSFEGKLTNIMIIRKKKDLTISFLAAIQETSSHSFEEDWHSPIIQALSQPSTEINFQSAKDYTILSRSLYHRLPGGILA
ncbi:hypothetical protein CFOL_v3_18407 [Cephalotus follicularis]|uniref:RVT_3 domain-containing protein n=1 Tax=Cephalotus follicularis TaxID=3775 RepID=A0A1Q3C3W6_CEPFO|nr:hypothetical protein CFOL_v3_18407 [Cephalotus follicularis]